MWQFTYFRWFNTIVEWYIRYNWLPYKIRRTKIRNYKIQTKKSGGFKIRKPQNPETSKSRCFKIPNYKIQVKFGAKAHVPAPTRYKDQDGRKKLYRVGNTPFLKEMTAVTTRQQSRWKEKAVSRRYNSFLYRNRISPYSCDKYKSCT